MLDIFYVADRLCGLCCCSGPSRKPATSLARCKGEQRWITSLPESLAGVVCLSDLRPASAGEVLTEKDYDQHWNFANPVLLRADPRVHQAAGAFMASVFEGERTFLHPVLRWLEVLTYKVIGVQEDVEQRWTQYTAALLSFSIFGFLLVYLHPARAGIPAVQSAGLRRRQRQSGPGVQHVASFITNTNWQAYSGESTLSYFVQMAALTVQNFASAAAGIAVAIALVRGFARQEKKTSAISGWT